MNVNMIRRDFVKLSLLMVLLLLWQCHRTGIAQEKATVEGVADIRYEKHLEELKKRVPEGFTIVLQHPFFVIGNEAPGKVKNRAVHTVKWAVDKLKKVYFKKDPEDIIDIWLFKDKQSYEKYAREFFGDEPSTPFGYFSDSDKALIMNISTGGGTLVHEIVHPFMNSNFPECPPWFDEGLASLYEQCGERDGHIYGYTNWRLAGLQKALAEGRVPSFRELTSMNDNAFYNLDKGTNYGQARYLCYYLQEKGLLVTFYHAFYENRLDDPTGYKTLKEVLKVEDMEVFRTQWKTFVMGLTFR